MKITIFDTSICSHNLGDFIIMDSVTNELKSIFPESMFLYSLTHDKISKQTYKMSRDSKYCFVGGTNLLSSNMDKYNQWKINLYDALFMRNIILMGVGWWQYQKKPNLYSKILFSLILSSNFFHSVRDSYTEKKLNEAGFSNVINTACPTMWKLSREHCHNIPTNKSEYALLTLTDYKKDFENDTRLINILRKNYNHVYFWPQGTGDLEYAKQLGLRKGELLSPNLWSLNSFLDDEYKTIDFIGTRLHAGILALQKKRRTIIIGVDNRSIEKGKDFNLPVISRDHLDDLHKKINSRVEMDIFIPEANISRWKQQFS